MDFNSILLFEYSTENLYPFNILHCGWEVRCGALRLFEKLEKIFPEKRIIYFAEQDKLNSFLARFKKQAQSITKENLLVLNSIVLPNRHFFEELESKYSELAQKQGEKSAVFVYGNYPMALYLKAEDIVNPGEFDKEFLPVMMFKFANHFPKIELSNVKLINYLWDTFDLIGEEINNDAKLLESNFKPLSGSENFYAINSDRIYVGENVKIMPGCVLDASEGAIILGNNVKIMPNAVVVGPTAILDNSIIKIGAKIYEKTSIGEYCKVGGEVENSVVHAYSNKQHDGFLGHSYISEWVNLGADTNTSDLKNTYSNIKVWLRNREVDTGRIFLGLLCGDHTKSAINTSFTTGTTAGICGILVEQDFLPNYIPSFKWGGKKHNAVFKIDKALALARQVMARRAQTLLPEEEILIRKEYQLIIETSK